MEGHKNIKSVAEGVKFFGNWAEKTFKDVEEGNDPELREKREKLVSCLMHIVSMIFGDEVHFEAFACPHSQGEETAEGALCWEKSGNPNSVKGSIRMDGASQIMQLMSFNIMQSWKY